MDNQEIDLRQQLHSLRAFIRASIIGQELLVDRMLTALMCGGHLLVEGAPGLAKTRAIKTLAQGIDASFQRIQFTPDLLPGDITGTEVYRQQTAEFIFQKGPIFNNIVLADEINRAPAKVQSALLEAMAEGQVSVGRMTYPMDRLFLTMATQNPIEQEGTYVLPEAQLDRFMLHVEVDYPSAEEELEILSLVERETLEQDAGQSDSRGMLLHPDSIFAMRSGILGQEVSVLVKQYAVRLVEATRKPGFYDAELASWIAHGASPRATVAMVQAAKAVAWLQEKEVVTPGEIQAVAEDALRHRIILSIEAEAGGKTASQVIQRLLDVVPAL